MDLSFSTKSVSTMINPLGAGGLIHPVCRAFLGNLFFFRFYTIMAKLLEITPINHIWKGNYQGQASAFAIISPL
jgi:hypothetical protein